MKTAAYNPSPLEVDFANALFILQKDIQKQLEDRNNMLQKQVENLIASKKLLQKTLSE